MSFYVARSRQKPPENAFQMRARLKAEQEAAAAAKAAPREPAQVADQMPDLDALREAAARAAALVHAAEPDLKTFEDMKEDVERSFRTSSEELGGVTGVVIDPEPTRGRPASSTVAARTARILELITESGAEGISKPDLAAAVETKEANVQVALGKLKDAGKVESRRLPDTGKYRWFAV